MNGPKREYTKSREKKLTDGNATTFTQRTVLSVEHIATRQHLAQRTPVIHVRSGRAFMEPSGIL